MWICGANSALEPLILSAGHGLHSAHISAVYYPGWWRLMTPSYRENTYSALLLTGFYKWQLLLWEAHNNLNSSSLFVFPCRHDTSCSTAHFTGVALNRCRCKRPRVNITRKYLCRFCSYKSLLRKERSIQCFKAVDLFSIILSTKENRKCWPLPLCPHLIFLLLIADFISV